MKRETRPPRGGLGDSIVFNAPGVGQIGIERTKERRWQTIAAFTISLYFVMPMALLCWSLSVWCLVFSRSVLTALVACYFGYAYLIDSSSTSGSRPAYMRGFRWWWSNACDYFPVTLVKTAELDPDKNYVMGYHPHGIISVGAMGSFATEGCRTLSLTKGSVKGLGGAETDDAPRGFSSLFPGIDRRLITLPQNFTTPFLREYILSMGCCDSSKETFRKVLARNGGKGNAVVVVVGGAAESMLVKPGEINLVLMTRRGFAREAILGNACLVPVIAFGENDLYEVFDTGEHWIARVQAAVKKYTGFAMPVFRGRSILFRDFGLMPQRKPIFVVVGAPIEPPKLGAEKRASFRPQFDRQTSKPLNEDGKVVEEFHSRYVKAVEELYAKYKDDIRNKPGQNRTGSLKIQ